MNSSRFLFIAVLAAAVVLTLSAIMFGFSGPVIAVGMGLLAGAIVGLALAGRLSGKQTPHSTGPPPESAKPATAFSPRLLDIAVNEMREGVLVIDAEMRVVASNRAARTVFSNVHEQIDSRRLTELTRNPAI